MKPKKKITDAVKMLDRECRNDPGFKRLVEEERARLRLEERIRDKISFSFEIDEDGIWVCTWDQEPGCHSQGRSQVAALKRCVGAMRLWIDS